ncbi:hypothetical protein [Sorangium sp. So ce426]|uniref:hypothetical protein n=1 Tax=Sorangium sp. So ce426 TaxID=3133312 RepID=UPI003F5C43AD
MNVLAPLAAGIDEVAAGGRHTCAREGAEVYCSGNDYNAEGQLGVSQGVGDQPSPVAVKFEP